MSLWDKLDQVDISNTGSTKKEYAPIPEGEYKAQITDISIIDGEDEVKFSVEYTISEGEFSKRKLWFNVTLDGSTSDKKLAFVKEQICKMANVNSTKGDVTGTLLLAKGNSVLIYVKNTPSIKDPAKTYQNVYCNGTVEPVMEF